jgi:protein-S-isoprenylcysteine O-methyltransferase Ste14
MTRFIAQLVPLLWVAWAIYWKAAAAGVKPASRTESQASRAAHLVPLAIAALLLWLPSLPAGWLCGRFLPSTPAILALGALVTAAGLLFSVWARVYLGGNWSAIVTLKAGHELIRSGPYRFVRHPIYTGLLVAFVGSAIARGEWRGVLAVLIALAALWRKLRLEERWLGEQFGQAYERYRAEVAALIPFVL